MNSTDDQQIGLVGPVESLPDAGDLHGIDFTSSIDFFGGAGIGGQKESFLIQGDCSLRVFDAEGVAVLGMTYRDAKLKGSE